MWCFGRNARFYHFLSIYLPVYSVFLRKLLENTSPKEIKKSQRIGVDFLTFFNNSVTFQEMFGISQMDRSPQYSLRESTVLNGISRMFLHIPALHSFV